MRETKELSRDLVRLTLLHCGQTLHREVASLLVCDTCVLCTRFSVRAKGPGFVFGMSIEALEVFRYRLRLKRCRTTRVEHGLLKVVKKMVRATNKRKGVKQWDRVEKWDISVLWAFLRTTP